MSRIFDAPRAMVWTALTDPKHVTKWYGGSAFGGRVRTMDVRKGGLWRHTLQFKDGSEMEMDFVYTEVTEPTTLAWKNANPPAKGMLSVLNTITLEEAGRKTKWTLRARFDSFEDRDRAAEMGFARVIADGCVTLNDIVRSTTPFATMLGNLLHVLGKAAEHEKAADLPPARLAPDMYPLHQQVQLACFHALDAMARLTGGTPTKPDSHLESLADSKARVKAAIATLEQPASLDPNAKIVIPLPEGKSRFEMTGEEYLYDWAIPHFYFHVVTAYDILRHAGVPLGKRDYLGSVATYLKHDS